uniref:Uncharacterized protein n=1 Tax=Triticum urartu TaxID=4572 RepID=A0A8R7PSM7_TRIUA
MTPATSTALTPTCKVTPRSFPDIISEYLGAESALPYLSPYMCGENLLVGANFVSAGIGILNDTGVQFASSTRAHAHMLESGEHHQDRAAVAKLPRLPAEAGGV